MTTIATIAAAGLCAAAMLAATAPDALEIGRPADPQAAACTEAVLMIGPSCPEIAPRCGTVDRHALRLDAFAGAPRNVCLIVFDESDRPQG